MQQRFSRPLLVHALLFAVIGVTSFYLSLSSARILRFHECGCWAICFPPCNRFSTGYGGGRPFSFVQLSFWREGRKFQYNPNAQDLELIKNLPLTFLPRQKEYHATAQLNWFAEIDWDWNFFWWNLMLLIIRDYLLILGIWIIWKYGAKQLCRLER